MGLSMTKKKKSSKYYEEKYAEISEKIIDMLCEEIEEEENESCNHLAHQMIAYLGYTISVLINTNFCYEHRLLVALNTIRSMSECVDCVKEEKIEQKEGEKNE